MFGNLGFGDNDKIALGQSSDLQIYHDGSHSYVKDNGTGNLKLVSNGTAVQIEKSDGENMAVFRTDGAVELYHNNAIKLETTSGGVSITGALTASGNVTAFSDVTLKKDIETIPNALDKVLGMRGVMFTVKDTDVRSTGVIAQEIEEQLPEVVMTNDDGLKSVAYGNVVGVLIEAIKELKAEIEELKGGN